MDSVHWTPITVTHDRVCVAGILSVSLDFEALWVTIHQNSGLADDP